MLKVISLRCSVLLTVSDLGLASRQKWSKHSSSTNARSFRAGESVKIALLMHGLAGLIDLKVNRQIYGFATQRTEEICGLVGIHWKGAS